MFLKWNYYKINAYYQKEIQNKKSSNKNILQFFQF
jgi:hypothetical protein